jgi:hypothetical protein
LLIPDGAVDVRPGMVLEMAVTVEVVGSLGAAEREEVDDW